MATQKNDKQNKPEEQQPTAPKQEAPQTSVAELPKAPRPLKLMIKDEEVQNKFREMLGDNAPSFLMSVLDATQNNALLGIAEPQSIIMAAAVAATMDLPINPNLGMAYIVGYKDWKRDNKVFAQFQIGWKGLVQLALRSSQFHRINVEVVHEGELVFNDRLTGDIEWKWEQDNFKRSKLQTIGVVAYFRLLNGFEKTLFMSDSELVAHATRYSESYKANKGQWKDDPVSMKKKTVLKLLLDKFAPKSIATKSLQLALRSDQAVIEDYEGKQLHYPDNRAMDIDELNNSQDQRNQWKEDRITELLVLTLEALTEDEKEQVNEVLKGRVANAYDKVIKTLESKMPTETEKND